MTTVIDNPLEYIDGSHVILWRLNSEQIGLATEWQVLPEDSQRHLQTEGDLERWRATICEVPGDKLEFFVVAGSLPKDS